MDDGWLTHRYDLALQVVKDQGCTCNVGLVEDPEDPNTVLMLHAADCPYELAHP